MAPKKDPGIILETSARFIAGTINIEEMGLSFEDIDIEQFLASFKTYFKKKCTEMLNYKEALYLSIGPAINTDNDGIYSNDMQIVLDYIEEKMQMKFYFYYGALLYMDKDSINGNWLPH